MATASTPYFEGQWSLNVSHVWISVRTLIDQSKLFLVVREICPPRRSCRSSQSSKAFAEPDHPIDRSNPSVGSAHNGLPQSLRRCSRRILSGQSDMTGCSPAGVGPEAASWRSVGCHRPPSVASTRPSAMGVRTCNVPKGGFSGGLPLLGVYFVASNSNSSSSPQREATDSLSSASCA